MFVMVLPHDGKKLMQINCCTVISRWWHLARNNPSASGNMHTERDSFASDKVWLHRRRSAHVLRPLSRGYDAAIFPPLAIPIIHFNAGTGYGCMEKCSRIGPSA